MGPWVDLHAYTAIELGLNGLGCFLWLLAYAALVTRIIRTRFVEMPAFVAAANFGWELVWSLWFHPRSGALFSLMYVGAVVLDVFIFGSILRFGRAQLRGHLGPGRFRAMCVANVLFWLAACYLARAEGLDDPLGARSGYVINVILSYTCLALLYRMNDPGRFSLPFALFRSLGTGFISLSLALIYPTSHWLHLLGAVSAGLDAFFVVKLTRDQRALRRRAPRGPAAGAA